MCLLETETEMKGVTGEFLLEFHFLFLHVLPPLQ